MRSALQGVTCKMINDVPDSDTSEMAQAMTEYPEWLSRFQVGIYYHMHMLSLNICEIRSINVLITNMLPGRMCRSEAFYDFGEQESRLLQNHHRTGAGYDSFIFASSPAVSTQCICYFTYLFLDMC